MNDNQLLAQLNEAQREAVTYVDGPSLVIAGAGSGKTRVLTYKIAYLLDQGMEPWRIMALTFTNKAANEMKERIGKLVGGNLAAQLRMGTFHSVFSRILRVEADAIGFNSNFTIYDEADSRSLLKTVIKAMNLDDKLYKPAAVHARISRAKNNLVSAKAYLADHDQRKQDQKSQMPELGKVFAAYTERCRKANAMDFDDLLVLTYELFRDHPDIKKKYADRFDYVLVDEYQDTNYVQQCIVLQLTGEKQRVCAVGDDSQSIYSFRGANIDNILGFSQHYDNARLFKLEQNYRSTQTIVKAANSLIKHNQRQIPKDVYSQNEQGGKIVCKKLASDKEEAVVVCREIKKLRRQEHGRWSDFAILYRTNAQSRSFEEEMNRQSMPYRIYGGMSFYQRKEIKDIIAYFRLVVNPDDEEAFKRIINYPARGIGQTTVAKIGNTAARHGVSLWRVANAPAEYALDVNRGTASKLVAFASLIKGFMAKAATEDAFTLGRDIIMTSGISADLSSGHDPEAVARQQNLEEFLAAMQGFVEEQQETGNGEHTLLVDYLQQVALLTDLDSGNGDDTDRVTLMTVHAAKGLEFPTVFIVGLEENIFPSPMSSGTLRELEEERRLLYVAITRAERHCIITCAENRWRFGQRQYDPPSRFIAEIDPACMEMEDAADEAAGDRSERFFGQAKPHYNPFRDQMEWSPAMQNSRPVASQFMADAKPRMRMADAMRRPASAEASAAVHAGNVIEHQRFGVGDVVSVEGTGENAKATVEFRNAGRKVLLLKFARFKVIG